MIYLIVTTCLIHKFGIEPYEIRKQRYIDCISHLLRLLEGDASVKPIIVENSGLESSLLDLFGCDVIYTNNNSVSATHKAVNELLDIHDVATHYNIRDEDTIVKLTGRYKMMDTTFLDAVKAHSVSYDAFVKFFNVCTLQYLEDDCVLGLIAIKRKHLTNFKYNLVRSPECEFATYVRKTLGDKVMEMKYLGLECQFADDMRVLYV